MKKVSLALVVACCCVFAQRAPGQSTAPSSGPAPDRQAILKLIEQLASDDFQVRKDSQQRLVEAGAAAVAELRLARDRTTDPEVKLRLEAILNETGRRFFAKASRRSARLSSGACRLAAAPRARRSWATASP